MTRRHAFALALLPLPVSGHAAFAQSASAQEIVLDTVVVGAWTDVGSGTGSRGYAVGRTDGYQPISTSLGTGTNTPIIDIPQSVAVVPRQVLVDQQTRSLQEALWNVSGITQTNSLGGTQDAFLRRGFGDNRDGGVLTDGLKTALPRSLNATTERVEVLKGPSSALYGILDPGGLINVVTKKPQYEFAGEVQSWISSFGGGGVSGDVTGPAGETGLAYRLVGEFRDTDYWRNFGEIERNLLSPSFAYETETTRLDFSYLRESYEVPFDRGAIFDLTTGSAVEVNRRTRFDEAYNVTDGSSDLATAALTHDLSEAWTLRANYAYSYNTYADNQARVTAYDAGTGLLTRRADATQDSEIEQHSARADAVGRVWTGQFEHELLLGVSFDDSDTLRTDIIRGPASRRFNIGNPVYGQLPASNAVAASDSDQTERTRTWSVYGQDSLHLNEDWILIGGLRYQHYDQTAGRGRPFNLNTDQSDGEIVPRLGLVYKVRPDVSLYGSWSRSFKPNSSIASAIGALPAETGESFEVGAKAELAYGITATAAVYGIDKQNVLYSEIVNGETRTTTAGEVRSRGVEIDLAGRVTERMDLIATYAYTDAEVTEDPVLAGNRLPNVARDTGSLFVAYDMSDFIAFGTLRAGVGGRYVGERAGSSTNSFDMPDYAVFDAFVSYAMPVRDQLLTLQLNVKNLTDETYYASSIGTNNLNVEIGEPLEATFTARLAF